VTLIYLEDDLVNVLYRLTVAALASLVILLMFGCESDDLPTVSHEDPTPDTLFEVRIGAVVETIDQDSIWLPVTVEMAEASLHAFDLLIMFEHPALVVRAFRWAELSACRWEYFSAERYACNGCPYLTFRVRGISDIEDTPGQPDTACVNSMTTPFELFRVWLRLDETEASGDDWLPVRFVWSDCTSNQLNTDSCSDQVFAHPEAALYVNDQPALDSFESIQDPLTGFPTTTGVQDNCYAQANSTMPPKAVGFVNGGILVVEPVETPFQIQIEKTHGTYQGHHEYVDVTLNEGSLMLSSFDFLIQYDASALTLVTVDPGEFIQDCGWEYFTYRYGASGNCGGGACPSGVVWIVSIADMNNGDNHPDCYISGPGISKELAVLDFLVPTDRTMECEYFPIRWIWYDCNDNSLNSLPDRYAEIGQHVVARDIFELESDLPDLPISDPNFGFPTWLGVQSDCSYPDDAIRFVDFINGGVDIICADSIDAPGDINLNNIPNEIADAVLFANYFVYGHSVFQINREGQIAASDVNKDGLTLGVADLVYLIRIINGDAIPSGNLETQSATVVYQANGQLAVDQPTGAAFVVVSGDVAPVLSADNMDMQYAFDGENTRILVWSQQGNAFMGDFLSMPVAPFHIELATSVGARVELEYGTGLDAPPTDSPRNISGAL
jgi:hypothetical protein